VLAAVAKQGQNTPLRGMPVRISLKAYAGSDRESRP